MSKELPPSRVAEQFVVRFPDGMRGRIAEAAKANNRSMNAEIVARLERSFTAGEEIEELAFESAFEATGLKREVERLGKLLEERESKARQSPTADEIADKVAERLPAMILEKLKQAAPDYAKPRRPLPPEGSDQ